MISKGTPDFFKTLGGNIFRKYSSPSDITFRRRYKACFGVTWEYVYQAWCIIVDLGNLPTCATGNHILWALLHMKSYATESILATICDCDEKTF